MRSGIYSSRWQSVLGAVLTIAAAGCRPPANDEVVVYTALDEDFSKPIFAQFAADTGAQVVPKFDTEATKTVGLTEAILAERRRPRCDVFWNNEILNTLRLDRAGLLEEYRSPAAAQFPAWAKSRGGT